MLGDAIASQKVDFFLIFDTVGAQRSASDVHWKIGRITIGNQTMHFHTWKTAKGQTKLFNSQLWWIYFWRGRIWHKSDHAEELLLIKTVLIPLMLVCRRSHLVRFGGGKYFSFYSGSNCPGFMGSLSMALYCNRLRALMVELVNIIITMMICYQRVM